jgi:hypothetical protein
MAPRLTGKSRLLLIDTCVIIEAHRLDIWPAIRGQCRVAVPKTVVDETIQVAREFDELNLRLETEIAEGLIESPDLPASDLLIVKEKCPPFPGQIDAGELECLACLLKDEQETPLVCSSDAVVFRYLGWIQKQELGVSLEEILRGMNLGCSLEFKLRKAFREQWTQKGFAEALQRGFLKP